jgi:hypothetical protein
MFIKRMVLLSLVALLASCTDPENSELAVEAGGQNSQREQLPEKNFNNLKGFGSNFGYRCEDEDGLSAGANISKEGECFTAKEAVARAKESCASAPHAVSQKPMKLVNIENWAECKMIPDEEGSNFGFRCEDLDGLSAGSNVTKDGKCFASSKAVDMAQRFCEKDKHPVSGKEMFLVNVSNWAPCEVAVEYGNNFGFRCEDEDGASAGGAVNKSGSCFDINEARSMAENECDRLHPVTSKQMTLAGLMNWGICTP